MKIILKNIILGSLFLLIIVDSKAQIGIGIKDNLQGVFHIDPKSDSDFSQSIPLNNTEDIIIDSEGNIGLGGMIPTHKLEVEGQTKINGSLTIKDGTESDGAVLISDAEGNAEWSPFNLVTVIDMVTTTPINVTNYNTRPLISNTVMTFSGDYRRMGIYQYPGMFMGVNSGIVVPKGKYMVIMDAGIEGPGLHSVGYLEMIYKNSIPADNSDITSFDGYDTTTTLLEKRSISYVTVVYDDADVFMPVFTAKEIEFFGPSANTGYFAMPPYSGIPKARIILMKYEENPNY